MTDSRFPFLAALLRWPADKHVLWLLAGALVYLSFGFTEMMGSDLWWHLAGGRELVQTGSLWLVDDWSYSELGEPWHNHEWLADLIFYGWASLAGVASLVVWKWLLMVSSFVLLQRVLTALSGNAAAALLAGIAAIMLAAPFLDMRPQLYGLLGIALLLNLCLEREPRLWELLPLFLLWSNLHGSFVFGLMLLGILVFPWRDPTLPRLRRAALVCLFCVGICLINPDGLRIFWLPLVYALNDDSPYRSIAEWRSPFEKGGIQSPLYPYSLVVAAALVLGWVLPFVRRAVPFNPAVLALALLTAAMSMTSRRFIILWAVAFALLLAPALAVVLRQRALQLAALPILLCVCIWASLRLAPYSLRPVVAFHYLTAEYSYPEGMTDFVLSNKLAGNTFAYYNWGGYLHWRTDGALKVFIDGRANTLFDDETYLDYVSVLALRPGWLEKIEESGAQLVFWTHARGGRRLTQRLMQTRRWILLFEDNVGAVLAHESLPLPSTLRIPRSGFSAQINAAAQALRKGDPEAAVAAASLAYSLRPWDQRACSWLKRTLQSAGRGDEADARMRECRELFRSRYLR